MFYFTNLIVCKYLSSCASITSAGKNDRLGVSSAPAYSSLRMIYLGVPGLSLSWVSQIGRYDSSGKVGQRWQQAHDGGELLTTDGEINLSYTERKREEREQSKEFGFFYFSKAKLTGVKLPYISIYLKLIVFLLPLLK